MEPTHGRAVLNTSRRCRLCCWALDGRPIQMRLTIFCDFTILTCKQATLWHAHVTQDRKSTSCSTAHPHAHPPHIHRTSNAHPTHVHRTSGFPDVRNTSLCSFEPALSDTRAYAYQRWWLCSVVPVQYRAGRCARILLPDGAIVTRRVPTLVQYNGRFVTYGKFTNACLVRTRYSTSVGMYMPRRV